MPRSVLVTGGSRGIGLAAAQALAAAGDRVAVTYLSSAPPEGLFAVRCDVTNPDEVEAAFERVEAEQGTVEVLVANAGITRDTLLLRMTDDDWDAVIATNLTGAYRVARRAARGMLRAHNGRMIFVSSVVGLSGSAGQANYAATKSGWWASRVRLAREFGSRGITANVVAPGFIETDLTAVLADGRRAELLDQIPLRRYGVAR